MTYTFNSPRRWLPSAINAVGRALRRIGLDPVRLEEDALLSKAVQRTGLDDFGDDSFREPLRVILASFDREVPATFVARIFVRDQFLLRLTNRLRIQHTLKVYPEIAHQSVDRPMFICGLPRTGSTLLHRLLAEDPANRVPRAWEIDNPVPPPDAVTYKTDPRIRQVERRLAILNFLAPSFRTIHNLSAKSPEECIQLMANDFTGIYFLVALDLPSYRRWFYDQDLTHAYRLHKRQLQLLQFRYRGTRWVLKAPQHLTGLQSLLKVYPDACVVQLHRDPLKAVPSCVSLIATMRSAFYDNVQPNTVGDEWLTDLARSVQRGMQARVCAKANPACSARFIDLHYRDLVEQPLLAVRQIYDTFGYELTEETVERMGAFLSTHPQHQHGKHHYMLEEFGLNASDVRERFSTYCEHFGVVAEE